jgi:replication fork clamp-binding protein CrfC
VIEVDLCILRVWMLPGQLTLLDTPGPNEAGQPHLQKMLSEQLARASAVLAVMDYTQLKSISDEESARRFPRREIGAAVCAGQ